MIYCSVTLSHDVSQRRMGTVLNVVLTRSRVVSKREALFYNCPFVLSPYRQKRPASLNLEDPSSDGASRDGHHERRRPAPARKASSSKRNKEAALQLRHPEHDGAITHLADALGERQDFLEALRRTLITTLRGSQANRASDRTDHRTDGRRVAQMQQGIRQAIRMIAEKLDGEIDHHAFEDQLSILQDDFLQILARRFPELTNTERKVCALLRLDLSTKDIAGILHVSPLTVNTHRRRIRVKLGLKRTNLMSYLVALETTERA